MLSPVSVYRLQTTCQKFPLVISLPSGTSATSEDTSYCSAPSSVLRRCQTARQRACKDCGHWPSLTVPPIVPAGAAELSRFSNIECPRMHRVFDSAGPNSNLLLEQLFVVPSRKVDPVGAPDSSFRSSMAGLRFPCQRFTCDLTTARA